MTRMYGTSLNLFIFTWSCGVGVSVLTIFKNRFTHICPLGWDLWKALITMATKNEVVQIVSKV